MTRTNSSKSKSRTRKMLKAMIFVCLTTLLIAIGSIIYLEYIFPPIVQSITVEAGSDYPAASLFCETAPDDIHYSAETEQLLHGGILNVPGTYPISLICRGQERTANVVSVDTTAPTAEYKEISMVNPTVLPDPEEFLTNITDVSPVVATYKTVPDISFSGTQDVTLLLTDHSGNSSEITSKLHILHDTEAPVITGISPIEAYVGTAVSYRSGISVTDNVDTAPVLGVDSSAVDLSTPGIYELIYTATDFAGNTVSVPTTIQVYEKKADFVEPEVIYSEIDGLLSRIIRDDMSEREKVEAVYCWVNMHTQYHNHSDKDDWLQEAYRLYKNRRSDCFGYFALYKLMLQRLGIPFIEVTKVKNHPEDSNHYWLLVSIDGGENYYHMDGVWSMTLCLVTDEQLDSFSRQHNNCFNRDKSLYPPTPTEPLPESELPYQDPVLRGTTH